MNRFEDVAFLQDHFLHDINKLGYFSGLCDGFQAERYPHLPRGVVRSVMGHTFLRADPIYVSDDVQTLWEHACETFELEKITRDDLVVPAGFAVLPRAHAITDIHGKTVRYRAFSWLPISQRETYDWDEGARDQGVWLAMLSNLNDVDDYWLENHIGSDGVPGSVIRDVSLAMDQPWSLMHGSPLTFDKEIATDGILDHSTGIARVIEDPVEVVAANHIYGEIQCFWRLMSQLVMTEERLPRQARRQRERELRVSNVKVLHLRRPKHPLPDDHEPQDANYSHRFIVDGHWRKQPYGPRANPTYKQIWISPYVKGPDDKPLITKRRGVEFDR